MMDRPAALKGEEYRQDAFVSGEVVLEKKKGRLPAMGWNSWNAFGSGNTEALTKQMADAMIDLGLDKLGYEYLVLDDGCYKQERVDGLLSNEDVKFPSGFKALADYIHAKGLKFGMYNDIGTNLCAGAAVGTCGHEMDDAKSYVSWDVDFLKVDNCYYLWDNATFSDAKNARFVFAPNIKSIFIKGNGLDTKLSAVKDGKVTGTIGQVKEDYVTFIGTYDGTGPVPTPVGEQSSELVFEVDVPENGTYALQLEYAAGEEEGVGSWLQVAVGQGTTVEKDAEKACPLCGNSTLVYDDFLPATESTETFVISPIIEIDLQQGKNIIRLMNHRRQENTLHSYATLLEGLNLAKPGHDILFSICEWGKTQPQDWGYKVGDSWRILNDITFQVGADGDPGTAHWKDDYTPSITSQYNKAVIMDEYAGLSKGWNDPDMLVIGMNGLTPEMNSTHMVMWCMMNAPLMLGMDLRRLKKDDLLYQIIANRELIALNQDALGVQAKRIYASNAKTEQPDKEYIRDIDRVDVLAKPLADGSVALACINVSETAKDEFYCVTAKQIVDAIGEKMPNPEAFLKVKAYRVKDLWTGAESVLEGNEFGACGLAACDNITIRVWPVE